MSSITRARRDAVPPTWQLPAAAALAWLSVTAMLLPASRGAAWWLTGRGWAWPETGGALMVSVKGILSGHPNMGSSATRLSALPPVALVYLVVMVAQVAWIALSLLVLRAWWRTWGPGMCVGLADRTEVEKVLGLSRMRHDRSVIRPDLYAKSSATGGRS